MSMAIFDLEQDSFLLNTGDVSGDDFPFQSRPYFAPVHTRTYVVTEPYLDVLTDGLVVTIACPVIDENDQVLGVAGLDLPINFMSHLVMESSYGDSGRSLVLDDSDIILAYADPSYINSHYSTLHITGESLETELENPTGNLVTYTMNGDTRLGMVANVDVLNWKIVTAMDYSEFDQISSIITALLMISVVFTLVICGFVISGKFSKELLQVHYKDTLTGFYNRAGFTSQVDTFTNGEHTSLGVISININGLKNINEHSGITAGDSHIKTCANQLKDHFGYEFYRMSGDEMLAIAPNVEESEFEAKISSLHEKMREEENYNYSFGHAWGSGHLDLWKLMQESETVMFINKQTYYSANTKQLAVKNNGILSDLLSYLADDEFMVYLQPQVHLKDGSLYGAEALIRRYDKKNEKMVFPDQFIPLYEQKSIIRHVDLFVVETVCKLLQQW